MWEVSERYHQLCYVAPEPRDTATAAGLKGFWMNYFATRAAPMGPVRADVVEAVFFYYSPKRVHRALPDAWGFASPERILEARYVGMDAALRRVMPDRNDADVIRAVALHRETLTNCPVLGRPLFAAWQALPWPEEPHLALWHATTLQREYRNSCHLLALGAHGLDGCETIVSHVAVDQAPRAWITDEAGWTEQEAEAAADRLHRRGWLNSDGSATSAGYDGRAAIEALTDELDAARWEALGPRLCTELDALQTSFTATFPPDDQLDWRQVYGPN